MKVAELEGAELDRWVALALGREVPIVFRPHRDWDDGGPLIDEYIAELGEEAGHKYACAKAGEPGKKCWRGADWLIAACRAIVASVYGEETPEVET